MSASVAMVAVIPVSNASIPKEAISVNAKQGSKYRRTTEVEGAALVSTEMKSFILSINRHTYNAPELF